MKKVFFYLIIEDSVDINENGGDYYCSSTYYTVNGTAIVRCSENYSTIEECIINRNHIIECYPHKQVSPIMEGWV